jgi:nucleotide-binding universal stress UspA family protein
MLDKILLAYDESSHAQRALEVAASIADSDGVVRVVHVRERVAGLGKGQPLPREGHEEAAKTLDEALAALKSKGVDASGVVRDAPASWVASEIVDEADNFGASIIVVGTRGMTDLVGIIIGSTSHKVLHLAKIPVLVVP